jgi:hypothetical protein
MQMASTGVDSILASVLEPDEPAISNQCLHIQKGVLGEYSMMEAAPFAASLLLLDP